MLIDQVMQAAPVIPVLVMNGEHDPAELANVLVEAGLPVLEVTLRTPDALDAVRAMAKVPGAIVGAGTVLNPRQLDAAQEAGAQFIVAPGLTEPLTRAAQASGIAYLPGVATAGGIMRGLDLGLERFKFFPAEAAGGLPALRSLAAPFGAVRFCPTGGITEATAPDWLAEPAVTCIGGSWLVKKGLSLAEIGALAARAGALRAR
ncbi:bifunctional 4-hydroxy-2-oxoglutarate aldolase/2-dehydro-3-deoxy-phosphogluconate aldolase [Sphingomonas astaxanthinifaciens]|uniref:2-dehydro-3-deoxy-phosphogluconate aldolase n=1 Tax=Sphingomonas astaxanthinifaciens DSM 22298 TaxID=1123267 RepID=A0ABQ5Z8E0_9SPHN|nr:bifunctional 4-hydroxy-2-oxoglutarate aldolase/2-dehydro-3-deoxy-phosphogluconate aldolase [Sphingomonas astaxanthinifaciens]GLR48197.1 bifunctional keto-hydroxyglutarate-aldolase/keto-deoxy-phosphogluconate aldolase [Sphingomonas astaxanthinifaciens DSM 22298]